MSADELAEQPMTERQIRAELGEVIDQLQALPPNAFAERSELRDRQAELAQMLREIDIPGADDIKSRWCKRAGRKDPRREKGRPFIASPMDGGSSGIN